MRQSILFTLIAGAAAVPHPNLHGHLHAEKRALQAEKRDYYTVTHYVTVSPTPAEAAASEITPDLAMDVAANNNNGPPCTSKDPPGFHGFTPGGFTPCGFTPRVTATGAQVITKANGQKSVSHLEQTLGLSTAARSNPTGGPIVQGKSSGPGSPVYFESDPSGGGPPTAPFEVIVNEPGQPGGRDYPGTILIQSNFHRNNASVPTLIWGFALQRDAQDTANKCVFQQDLTQNGGGYGQALVAGVSPNQVGQVITDAFYNSQVNAYNSYGQEPDISGIDNWGFYTQLVWKSTKQIGCYSVDCSGKGGLQGGPGGSNYFTVCNFWPAGNVIGQFSENVLSPNGAPTMNWDDSTWQQVAGNG